MDTSNLLKYRSVTACMKASYDLLCGNIVSLLKKTWWAILVFAILMSLTIYFRMPNLALHDWGEANPWPSYLIQTFIYLGYIVSAFIAGGVLWNWFNGKGMKANLSRFFVSTGIFAVLMPVLCVAAPSLNLNMVTSHTIQAMQAHQAMPTSTYVISALLGVLNIVLAFVCLIPFGYIVPKCMMREPGEPIHPWGWYKCGLRHSGAIFKTVFLGGLMLFVMYLIISIPSMIIGYVQLKSQLGTLDGDPSGVPNYFPLLFLVVFILTTFLFIYLSTWVGFSFAYLFGSIEAQEKEKQERLKEMAAENAIIPNEK